MFPPGTMSSALRDSCHDAKSGIAPGPSSPVRLLVPENKTQQLGIFKCRGISAEGPGNLSSITCGFQPPGQGKSSLPGDLEPFQPGE